MKKYFYLIILSLLASSCGYHLRSKNALAQTYALIHIEIASQSALKRNLISAMLASGVHLSEDKNEQASNLKISKDRLRRVVQSIGANNQVQEFRLEYDVEYELADKQPQTVHLERDYSFDIQQIGGSQTEEASLRKQLTEDMAWAIIRQINASIQHKK
jgi:outer membrane lipopolysaccharide assembly protein LptE/RlpB